LDLTMQRMRQIREEISRRLVEDRRRDLAVTTQIARLNAQFTAAAAGAKKLLADANQVNLLPPFPGAKKRIRYAPAEQIEAFFNQTRL
jgi:hypothetical protein